MTAEEINTYMVVGGFLLQLIVVVGGGVWKFYQLENTLCQKIEESRKELDERLDVQYREFSESVHALRQKIHEVEIWSRDTFMRRDGFYKIKEELSVTLKEVRDELRADLRRLENKIDTKT